MELQFTDNACRYLNAAVRDVRSTELTQEVRLSDGMPDIGRVIASWGQVILRSKEWQGDQVSVTGGIMVWILYAPEDSTPPRSIETWIPFQLKWEPENVPREGNVLISPLLRFVDSRGISARKMMVRAGVCALCEAMSSMEANVFQPAELPEDIQILQNTYPVRLPVEAGEKTFLLDEDLLLPAGAPEAERLLAYTMMPQLQEKRVAGDKVILRGTGTLHVIYRCAEGRIHTASLEIPISQYAQLEIIHDNDAQADVMMGVTSLELLEGDGGQLRLKCGLVAQYLISDRCLISLTEDAYSPQRDVELQMQELELPAMLEQRSETVSARQMLPGITGDVVDVTFLPDYPRQNRISDAVMLELPGQFQVLYYAQDGSLQGATARWEGNLQIPADPESRMTFLVQPQNCQALRGTEDLDLSGNFQLQMNTFAQRGMPMVTGLDIGQLREKDPTRPTLILCRPNGETLWETAKRCGSTVADIQRINKLEGQIPEERMLLIPVN